MFRTTAYRVALVSSILVILLISLAFFADIIEYVVLSEVMIITPIVPLITAFLTALSTFRQFY
jgi:hypothetical protein